MARLRDMFLVIDSSSKRLKEEDVEPLCECEGRYLPSTVLLIDDAEDEIRRPRDVEDDLRRSRRAKEEGGASCRAAWRVVSGEEGAELVSLSPPEKEELSVEEEDGRSPELVDEGEPVASIGPDATERVRGSGSLNRMLNCLERSAGAQEGERLGKRGER